MRALIADDDTIQLRRIDSAIAAIRARTPAEQSRSQILLAALQTERMHILHYNARAGRSLTSRAHGLRKPAMAPGAAAGRIAMGATP